MTPTKILIYLIFKTLVLNVKSCALIIHTETFRSVQVNTSVIIFKSRTSATQPEASNRTTKFCIYISVPVINITILCITIYNLMRSSVLLRRVLNFTTLFTHIGANYFQCTRFRMYSTTSHI